VLVQGLGSDLERRLKGYTIVKEADERENENRKNKVIVNNGAEDEGSSNSERN
jgi:hypothetical protein